MLQIAVSDKQFTNTEDLKTHMLNQIGEKPYARVFQCAKNLKQNLLVTVSHAG